MPFATLSSCWPTKARKVLWSKAPDTIANVGYKMFKVGMEKCTVCIFLLTANKENDCKPFNELSNIIISFYILDIFWTTSFIGVMNSVLCDDAAKNFCIPAAKSN